MSRFFLTPQAHARLKSIALYTERQWGKAQRRTYLKALDDRFHDLAVTPQKGKPRPHLHPDVRSYAEGKHVIYYLPKPDHIVIVDILHAHMDPDKHIDLQ